jgi:ATP-dependent protease HslVU (ClpYQ) peptidase subunit
MTTIAYRDGVLAGDTRITEGENILPERERKVHRLRNGFMFGGCGASTQVVKLKTCVAKSLKPPKLNDCNGIMITPQGEVWFYENGLWLRVKAPYIAIGRGRQYAFGALKQGASAVEAVRVACAFDVASGLPVHHITFRKPKKEPI